MSANKYDYQDEARRKPDRRQGAGVEGVRDGFELQHGPDVHGNMGVMSTIFFAGTSRQLPRRALPLARGML